MPDKTVLAFLAPGQGSQTPGMLAEWLELPGAATRIASWSEISGLDLARLGRRLLSALLSEKRVDATALARVLLGSDKDG